MNQVNLIGRITKDPEIRKASNDKSFCAFTLAVNEFSGGNQFTQFVPCFAWEKTAENLAKYLNKGSQVAIEGALNVKQDNKNGVFTQIITVRVNKLEFIESAKKESKPEPKQEFNDDILWED